MAELRTKPTRKSVKKFIDAVENEGQRKDCHFLLETMQKITGEKPVIWGTSIVGFGKYQYQQRDGTESTWPLTGFSPRRRNLTIYIMPGFSKYKNLLRKLGKHKHSVSCLYLNKLADIDITVLEEIISDSVCLMRERYIDGD